MQLTVNYSYVEQVIPPRCRKPRPQRFDDGVFTIDICEVTAEQAPVAILGFEKDEHDQDVSNPIVYRWHAGRLWTSCPVYACSRRGTDLYGSLGPVLSLVKDTAMLSHPELGIYVCVYEGRDGVAAHIAEAAEDLLIIDGQLHRPAGEPLYVVMTFGLSNDHGGTSMLCADHLNPNIRPESYFSLLEHAEAIEYTRKVALARGDTRMCCTSPSHRFEVLLPDAIQWKNPSPEADVIEGAA